MERRASRSAHRFDWPHGNRFSLRRYLNVRTVDHAARTNTIQSGVGDSDLLFKYNLFGNDGSKFAFGILPYLKIPTNTANLGSKRVEGGIILPLSINLSDDWNLSLQTEFDAVRNEADTRFEPAFTNIAYLGYTFLNKKLTVYGEWYSQVTQGPDSQVDGEVDTGAALLHRQGRGDRLRLQLRRHARRA